MKYGNMEIVDTAGWDLTKEIPDYDYHFEKPIVKIPSDFACGIKAIYNEKEKYTVKYHRKPLVTLVMSTWKGMCGDAIHINGRFDIRLPEFENDEKPGYTVGCWDIPILKNNSIILTQVVTEWDIKAHPQNYEFWRVGTNHPGFYGSKSLKMYAERMFNEIFDIGWGYEIDQRF